MTSHAAATVNMRNATVQVTRSGLGRLNASQPMSAAQRPAISAAVAGSAITGDGMVRDLQSCRRVYRRDRGVDDAFHGDRAVQTGRRPEYLPPPARPGTFTTGRVDL